MLALPPTASSSLAAPPCRRRNPAPPRCAAQPPEAADPENALRGNPFGAADEAARRRKLTAELMMLNARLAGGKPHVVRQRVEWLQSSRRQWDLVHRYVTESDTAITLSLIEAARLKVSDQLAVEARGDNASTSDLVAQLATLQASLAAEKARVAELEARVGANLGAVRLLESEARSGEAGTLSDEVCLVAAGGACMDPLGRAAPATPTPRRRKGMDARFADAASLALPARDAKLCHLWHPIHFLSKARDGETLHAFGELLTLRLDPGAASGWAVLGAEGHALPTAVWDGMLAIWPGAGPPGPLPAAGSLAPPSHYTVHVELVVDDIPAEHGLLIENLLDLAHAPFTHTGTFAKGWGVPSAVRFVADAARAPGDGWAEMGLFLAGGTRGSWAPYPIDMQFHPPTAVLSHVGLAAPGAAGGGAQFVPGSRAGDCAKHLHQLHVCVPSRPGRTRLLYRMALDFAQWAALVPGMHLVWAEMAAQVLAEDMRLVQGQQDRMGRGERVWGHPVPYDACALAYRRFRNDASRPAQPAGR